MFNEKGAILCDRLVFTGGNDNRLDIRSKTNKPVFHPHELVEMEFSVVDKEANPIQTSFSLSIKDGESEVEYKHNILTELLLTSEIKGFVRNPSWYFDKDDDEHHSALDLLLMIQGWRRYSWEQMTGIEPLELKNLPEQGIETSGQVVSFLKGIPKPNVKVDMLLQQRGEEQEQADFFIESYVTDKQGRFSFLSDVDGRWNMMLVITEKNKKKDHWILLDRVLSPEPKRYRYADLQVNIADNTSTITNEEPESELEEAFDTFSATIDSLSKTGITDKVHMLPEVTVTGKRNEIRNNRSTSTAYYDVTAEFDNFYDQGKYIGDDIDALLVNLNKNFLKAPSREYVLYNNKLPLFVINYNIVDMTVPYWYTSYKRIKLGAIKDIYINDTYGLPCQYAYHPKIPCYYIDDLFSCVVFIETYPDERVPTETVKGVRKTWLEGYSAVKEFYNPDYSIYPPEPDYRRILYWNPAITTDEYGIVKIQFYNNSSCRNFSISAETVTSQGMIGIYKNE